MGKGIFRRQGLPWFYGTCSKQHRQVYECVEVVPNVGFLVKFIDLVSSHGPNSLTQSMVGVGMLGSMGVRLVEGWHVQLKW